MHDFLHVTAGSNGLCHPGFPRSDPLREADDAFGVASGDEDDPIDVSEHEVPGRHRDPSDLDAFVECQVPASIPLYRLVHFQIERGARECDALPLSLRNGKVLSAVYRVGAYRAATGTPHGYALRLLVEPARPAPPTMSVVAN